MPTSYKAAFIINARNKGPWVAQAVRGALAQTYPCHIVLSDQGSDDDTFAQMELAAADSPSAAEHKVELVRCPIGGAYGMVACNQHFDWCIEQTDAEWVFQCSADDYSLPERVAVCMAAAEKNPCAIVANTMYFAEPGQPVAKNMPMSGYPTTSGFVAAGEGLSRMAYGSTIHGYRRAWLKKVGNGGANTIDVFYGFLAALNEGFYVVANPQHVHVMHADASNMGFQGKMRAAEKSGDAAEIARTNELNRYQLCRLYYETAVRAQQLYPMAHTNDMNALVNMILSQTQGWLAERARLHEMGVTPGVL